MVRTVSTLRTALAARRLSNENPAWSLLRARNAAVAVAILGEHLAGDEKRLPAPVLFERVEEDLALLRDHDFDLPQAAQAYCGAWRDDGVLIRRVGEGSREETFELSEGALVAIRFVEQLADPRQSVTESRLTTILEQVRQLALETDPDASSRLALLHQDRDRIDAEIARVDAGDFTVLSADRALERAVNILGLSSEIPADFARVRAEMESINRALRERLVEQDGSRGTVLDEVFRGVDHLAESDAGRSFSGFYALILDPERSAEFEDNVSELLDRRFAAGLPPAQSRTLRRLLPSLQDASAEIHETTTRFSRSLRRFVQSQDVHTERVITTLLRQTLQEALLASTQIAPFHKTDLTLNLTSASLDSVAALRLHNPADAETVEDVTSHTAAPVDVQALRELSRASEIDLRELTGNVNDALAGSGPSTIAEVLDTYPATQGVASVVGLLLLAEEHAVPLPGDETVRWVSTTAVPRHGTIPRYLFKETIR